MTLLTSRGGRPPAPPAAASPPTCCEHARIPRRPPLPARPAPDPTPGPSAAGPPPRPPLQGVDQTGQGLPQPRRRLAHLAEQFVQLHQRLHQLGVPARRLLLPEPTEQLGRVVPPGRLPGVVQPAPA